MGARIFIKKINPPASLADRRASAKDQADWGEADRAKRTCQHCHTPYQGGGDAWVCEHYHEGI